MTLFYRSFCSSCKVYTCHSNEEGCLQHRSEKPMTPYNGLRCPVCRRLPFECNCQIDQEKTEYKKIELNLCGYFADEDKALREVNSMSPNDFNQWMKEIVALDLKFKPESKDIKAVVAVLAFMANTREGIEQSKNCMSIN